MDEKTLARFWSKVEKTEGCWLWKASLNTQTGYGQFYLGGGPKSSHRVSWEIANGPVSGDLHVLHTCDVRCCVRPDHLFLGTPKDNAMDKAAKLRAPSRLRPDDVREIRAMLASGIHHHVIAAKFNVHRSLITCVNRRTIWAWLE